MATLAEMCLLSCAGPGGSRSGVLLRGLAHDLKPLLATGGLAASSVLEAPAHWDLVRAILPAASGAPAGGSSSALGDLQLLAPSCIHPGCSSPAPITPTTWPRWPAQEG